MKKLSLYLHVPYCTSKCHYCGFFTVMPGKESLKSIVKALKTEIELRAYVARDHEVHTIYFGGGTPSLLSGGEVGVLLDTIRANYRVNENVEVTLEANPESLTDTNCLLYKKAGINRLSFGLQAWQPRLLKVLGRQATPADLVKAYQSARTVFSNINIDIIFGIPGQSIAEWSETITNVIALNPDHISAYSLELDKKSIFGAMYRAGKLTPISPNIDRTMAKSCVTVLKKAGYIQYEVSNFAKPGFQCLHNYLFWRHEDYLGFGPSAYAYFNHIYSHNIPDIHGYVTNLSNGMLPPGESEKTDRNTRWNAHLLLGLRLKEGFLVKELERFGPALTKVKKEELDQLLEQGLITFNNGTLAATPEGYDRLDAIEGVLAL